MIILYYCVFVIYFPQGCVSGRASERSISMARSRHSVAWRHMSQTGQSHRQQRAPRPPQSSQQPLTFMKGCRTVGSQPQMDEHSEHKHMLQPLSVASRQSSGRQNRQARSTAAQASQETVNRSVEKGTKQMPYKITLGVLTFPI